MQFLVAFDRTPYVPAYLSPELRARWAFREGMTEDKIIDTLNDIDMDIHTLIVVRGIADRRGMDTVRGVIDRKIVVEKIYLIQVWLWNHDDVARGKLERMTDAAMYIDSIFPEHMPDEKARAILRYGLTLAGKIGDSEMMRFFGTRLEKMP